MQRVKGVPAPVVRPERHTAVLVQLAVPGAEVASVLGDPDHALVGAVERSVEDALLVLGPAFDLDLPERRVPLGARLGGELLEVEVADLGLQVPPRLLDADVGDRVAQPHGARGRRKGNHHGIAGAAGGLAREIQGSTREGAHAGGRGVELGVKVDRQSVIVVRATDRRALDGQRSLLPGPQQDEILLLTGGRALEGDRVDRRPASRGEGDARVLVVEEHRVAVGQRDRVVVAGAPLGAERSRICAGRHHLEHLALPVRGNAEPEAADAIAGEALVGGNHTQHSVRPLDGGERGHQHMADRADARVDVVDRVLRPGCPRGRGRGRKEQERDAADMRLHESLRPGVSPGSVARLGRRSPARSHDPPADVKYDAWTCAMGQPAAALRSRQRSSVRHGAPLVPAWRRTVTSPPSIVSMA